MSTVTIQFKLREKTGQIQAQVQPTKDKKVVRLTLGPNDPGRLEQRAIIASCQRSGQPYRWT